MEGIKIVIFALVAVVWLAIWIIKMFRNAFNQPSAKGPKPYIPAPDVIISETIREKQSRQRQEKRDQVVLERTEKPVIRSLEIEKPAYRSMESLEPRRRSLEIIDGTTGQREDIVQQRRERNIYQASDKKPISRYAALLHNPQSARDAIVLAEILKPKF